MAKKKKIGSTWSRRDRLINGKPRRIWVRKIDGKYQQRSHKPEIHGIALASKLMAQRPKKSQIRDKQRSNKNIISPTDKNLKRWKKRPGSADIKGGVDTKTEIHKFIEEHGIEGKDYHIERGKGYTEYVVKMFPQEKKKKRKN